uniref:HEAT repeat-containing protein 5B n=2 Tax=Lutzomyia longipalpis TaxID=7200 RepID=A0A1B0CEK2_LUTLO
MLDHFAECIKHAKTTRQEAVQMNIFTALLSGLKGLTETKSSIGQEDKKSATSLIITSLVSTNSVLGCAAGEALGRIAQVVGDSRFTAELAQTSFDRLKSARDVVTRTGHSLALGCLHRYVGGMGSSQHLNTSVSILLALAQDGSSPVVQVWSLYALSLIADSGGPMFRGYVEPTLSLCLKLLLSVPQTHMDVHQCIGRVLSALITTIGPELQGNNASISAARSSFLCACAIMHAHSDPLCQAEATGCPPAIASLRSTSFSCLRQLTQREAKEVCDHGMTMIPTEDGDSAIPENGLPGYLFGMLDTETDPEMIKNIHDTLMSMLQMLASENLSQWLGLCKNVLTVATDFGSLSANDEASAKDSLNVTDTDNEDDDMDMEYHAEDTTTHPSIQPRWPTRVFAAECVRKIISSCENSNPAHFDLHMAKEYQLTKSKGDYLVLHLSDLIRMAFMAATSDSDHLRLAGLKTLQEVIDRFARVPEPEFPGHLLLEQFQAQVGAALRPAFAPDTPSHVTAAACEVCSTWIGSGVARDMNDLRRVHQLLVSSLSKLSTRTNSTQLYNESMATLEKLMYIVAMVGNGSAPASVLLKKLSTAQSIDRCDDDGGNLGILRVASLLALVRPELSDLSQHWLAALKDHALLLLPNGGCFLHNRHNAILPSRHYMSSWPPIIYAASLWLNAEGFALHENTLTANENANDDAQGAADNNNASVISHGSVSADRFHMIFGICMEALCSTRSSEKNENIITCLQSLSTIFDSTWAREQLIKNTSLNIELCNVLHRLILTRDSIEVQLLCMEVLKQTLDAAKQNMEANKASGDNCNVDSTETSSPGEESGDKIVPGKSHIYAVLEVCFCLFVRQIPTMNPMQSARLTVEQMQKQWGSNSNGIYKISQDSGILISSAIQCLESLPPLCTDEGALSILPTILYLTTTVIKEIATKSISDTTILANSQTIQATLKCLKAVAVDKYAKHETTSEQWCQ